MCTHQYNGTSSLFCSDVRCRHTCVLVCADWVAYYNDPLKEKLLNVISLEISLSKLSKLVQAPSVVRKVDWIDSVWPRHLKRLQRCRDNNMCVTILHAHVHTYTCISHMRIHAYVQCTRVDTCGFITRTPNTYTQHAYTCIHISMHITCTLTHTFFVTTFVCVCV